MEIQIEKEGKSYLRCEICEHEQIIPKHCGKQMGIVGNKLVCWKGDHKPCCNSVSIQNLPYHHGKPMTTNIH